MGIGASVFLIALGAILAFAVNASVGGLDLDVVGWILMGAGLLGLVVTMMIWGNRRRAVVTEEPATYRRVEEPATYRRVEERRDAPPL
ncbi:DUF6458 family protein [Phytohabitans kaempferiae]|uniref:DUF6458 family protein n=1 Tax=Phytohabitans kaempferiae TaxID=1620943 RepID=A0ABV6M1N4_9ACTN